MATKKSMRLMLMTLILIGLTSLLLPSAKAAATWPIPDGVKTIEVNGYDMAYQETGSGIALVLIHGSLTDYRTWKNQIPEFSKAYRVIAVSLRHHYPEKWYGEGSGYSIEQHAADVATMIQKLSLGKVHLLGHSRGGPVAVMVASLHPEAIRTLILEDGNLDSLLPDTAENQKRKAEWIARGDTALANLKAGQPEKAAQEWLDSYGGPGTWERFPAAAKPIILDNIGSATDRGDRGKINCADIQKFSFPILLLTGEKSPPLYKEIVTVLRQCKPDIPPPIVVPNGTHSMHSSNPGFFTTTVLEFLNKH